MGPAVCLAIALPGSDVPTELIGRCGLARHLHHTGGGPEFHFHYHDRRPRLHVERQNLKGPEAAKAIAQQTNPNTIDHDTAFGDKDHTQQVTNLKVTLKKKGEPAH